MKGENQSTVFVLSWYLSEMPAWDTYMVDDLVGNAAVVLQDVKVLGPGDLGHFLCHGLDEEIVSSVDSQ